MRDCPLEMVDNGHVDGRFKQLDCLVDEFVTVFRFGGRLIALVFPKTDAETDFVKVFAEPECSEVHITRFCSIVSKHVASIAIE